MIKKTTTKELLWFYYYQINNDKRIAFFLFLVILVALFETVSIGAAMPIIGLFVNPDFIFSIKIFKNIFESFNISSIENYKFTILVFFISIVIMSAFIRFVMMKFIISFTKKITSNVAANVFQSSVCNEYSQIIKNSPNLILSGITNKVEKFSGILHHYFNFISGLFLSVSIIIALFFLLNPIMVIAGIFFIAILYSIISISVKHFLLKNSSIAATYDNLRIKTLEDCLGNIKNILLDGSEFKYSQYFKNSDIKYRKAQARVELV
jgi:ATP-binding cassette subfamily B protein